MEHINKPVVIFGIGRHASLAAHCLTHDTGRTVAAFTVDPQYVRSDSHDNLPLIPFNALTDHFSPDTHEILLPLGHRQINAFRKERCGQAKAMGYTLTNYVSNRASVWPDTPIGENVIIYESATLQSFVRLGDNVTVRSGVNIGHHSRVGSHTFIASGAVTGGSVEIGEQAWIGLGAVLRDGIRIGERCFVGAGAVVVGDTEPDGVYVGVPAKRLEGKTSLDITE